MAEVAAAVRRRVPILVDGGFRRGTDVFKALALGASAVGIGRPYIWGLAAHGQQGVERVLDILNNELRLAMIGCGVLLLTSITVTSITTYYITNRGATPAATMGTILAVVGLAGATKSTWPTPTRWCGASGRRMKTTSSGPTG